MNDVIEEGSTVDAIADETRLLTDVIKLKQHLVKIAKQGCDNKEATGTSCADAGVATPCGPCYATEILIAEKTLDTDNEPFNIHIDGVPSQPGMTIRIARTDNKFPLIMDGDKPQAAMQEALLRFMGVLIDTFRHDRGFVSSAAKWGLVFEVDTGDVTPEAATVA